MTSENTRADLRYLNGFGNEFQSESILGALPLGRNSPQRPAHGLFAELISGTAFTAPRAENRRTWLYRTLPTAVAVRFAPYEQPLWTHVANHEAVAPDPMRWRPTEIPADTDFIDGLRAMAVNGDPDLQVGMAALIYVASKSMVDRVIVNTDAEMLLVPQLGPLLLTTELGLLEVRPGEVSIIPRGMAFSVGLPEGQSRGYVCENFGNHFRLPELGPIGSNGLA
ncbi:MAG: homogentisate 1,2-dioxygenase, partial [Alcaligenaceae bacterium]